jgi:Flp pilus assembly protein TadB
MAKQRRRRKHKGTQAGTVRKRRPTSRAQARATTEQRRQERQNRPPTWRSSVTRGVIAAGALLVLLAVISGNVGQAVVLAVAAFVIYVPAFHMIDSALYRRRALKREREQQGEQ